MVIIKSGGLWWLGRHGFGLRVFVTQSAAVLHVPADGDHIFPPELQIPGRLLGPSHLVQALTEDEI